MVGPQHQDCNCLCGLDPNCLGCALPATLPLEWIMDFAAPMTQPNPLTGTVTELDTQIDFFPTIETRWTRVYDWVFPDLVDFGNSTSLLIDDAAVLVSGAAITECVWANDSWLQYESGFHNGIEEGLTGCPSGGVVPARFYGTEYDAAGDAWHYANTSGSQVPPWYSLNRVRTSIATVDTRCGTNDYGTCQPAQLTWSCGINAYGAFAVMLVERSGDDYILAVYVFFYPRYSQIHDYIQQRSPFPFKYKGGVAGPWTRAYFDASQSAPINAPPRTMFSDQFPSATSIPNVGAGNGKILKYTRTFACSTELDGSPLTLTKVEEYKAYSGATQTLCEALGIEDVPATITLTPVIV